MPPAYLSFSLRKLPNTNASPILETQRPRAGSRPLALMPTASAAGFSMARMTTAKLSGLKMQSKWPSKSAS